MENGITFDVGKDSMHLGLGHAHPYVLSAGAPGRVRKIAPYLKDAEVVEAEYRGLVVVHGFYKGLPVTAFSTGMGPASVSITLPEVIEACPEKKMVILRLGTAGALKKGINVGDFIITTEVDRHESTSDKFMGEGYVAVSSPVVRDVLKVTAYEHKHDFQSVHVGKTKVTNEIYLDALESLGKDHGDLLAVSMEFSVYCACRDWYNGHRFQQIQVGNLLTASNSLTENIPPSEFERRKPLVEDAQIRIGLETLLRMSVLK